jgi:hypothetical protein
MYNRTVPEPFKIFPVFNIFMIPPHPAGPVFLFQR